MGMALEEGCRDCSTASMRERKITQQPGGELPLHWICRCDAVLWLPNPRTHMLPLDAEPFLHTPQRCPLVLNCMAT
jgi:hypothetical protein